MSTPSTKATQEYGTVVDVRLGLSTEVRLRSVQALNRMLAHSLALRDAYKKAHWQTSGATFYQLHQLFDKHHGEQAEVCDSIAERVQTLGGVSIALAHDVDSETRIARGPRGRESVAGQLARLADAHELILTEARALAHDAAEQGDDGTNDILVSELVRTNELQAWFVHELVQLHA